MSTPSKICIRCGQDCSAKPRTKDLQGRYTCRACYDKLQAAAAKPAAAAAAPPADDDAAYLADLADNPYADDGFDVDADLSPVCPSCGLGMSAGATVCARCGYNVNAAPMPAMHSEPARGPSTAGVLASSAAGALGSAAGAMGGATAVLLGSLIGAVIAGAIGAGVWAAIAYNTGYEIGWIAWGVGIAVGIGAAVGSRGHTGLLTGGIAVVVAIVALMAGKYITVSMVVDDFTRELARGIHTDEENGIAMIARGVAEEHERAGKRYTWPETAEWAIDEEDFPPEIWADAAARWERLDAEQRSVYMDAATHELHRLFSGASGAIAGEVFLDMFSFFDLLFFGLAIVSAAGLGSGGSMSGNDD